MDSNIADSVARQLREGLETYRQDRSAAAWTSLSQLWIGEIQVVDALKNIKPEFPDPLPLPVDGVIEDDSQFLQWPVLPDPDDVERAILAALPR